MMCMQHAPFYWDQNSKYNLGVYLLFSNVKGVGELYFTFCNKLRQSRLDRFKMLKL